MSLVSYIFYFIICSEVLKLQLPQIFSQEFEVKSDHRCFMTKLRSFISLTVPNEYTTKLQSLQVFTKKLRGYDMIDLLQSLHTIETT